MAQISKSLYQSVHDLDKRDTSKANTAPTFPKETSAIRVLKSSLRLELDPERPKSLSKVLI